MPSKDISNELKIAFHLTTSILSDKKFRYFFAVWWLLWMLMQYAMLRQVNIDETHAIIDSIIGNVLLAFCCFFITNNMKYYLPRQEKYWYILVASLSLSLLWMLAQQGALWAIFPKEDMYPDVFRSTWYLRFGAGFLLISSISMFSLLWYNQQDQKEINSRKQEAERLSREAELFKLRQQLQPHFLFNSLNSISALTGTNPEKARYMIQQLSEFLRGTLRKDEQQWNTLGEELKHLQLYLEIEKVRFGHRLQTQITFDEEMLPMRLPALLLQPIVENAIKFGLYDTIGDVIIKITANRDDGHLKITVENPYDAETSQPFKGTGFGLTSIRRRLFLLFARNDLLQTNKLSDQFITTVLIPVKMEETEREQLEKSNSKS